MNMRLVTLAPSPYGAGRPALPKDGALIRGGFDGIKPDLQVA
jgi:hypothetical protein